MKRRFTDEQINWILQEAELAGNVRDVCRQHNIAQGKPFIDGATGLVAWRSLDEKRLRALKQENTILKRLVGELSLDNRMLRDVLGKKW